MSLSPRSLSYRLVPVILSFLSVSTGLTAQEPADVAAVEADEMVEGFPGEVAESDGDNSGQQQNWQEKIDAWAGKYLVAPLSAVLFFDFGTGKWLGTSIPFIVAWLVLGATFLTLRMGFINLRGFWHAVRITKGDYDNPEDAGEVSHFQALSSALSATVGLGNIAGVAIAVGTGGPGALFWMIVGGFLGMTSKFTECTLAQMYRKIDPDGRVSGGPMRYLYDGLVEKGPGFAGLGRGLSLLFALLCIGASFGGGSAFQVSQSMELVMWKLGVDTSYGWIYGVTMAFFVGIVIIGGIRRIASTAEKIVPLMCGIYVLAALIVLGMNYEKIPDCFRQIFQEAFSVKAVGGGVIGTMIIGFKRAAFSNEAGCGSAAIAHAAAKTKYPLQEGMVALLEPFIDTVVVCTMTGLVIIITGVHEMDVHAPLIAGDKGARLASAAFGQEIMWFTYILALAVVLFAYSTMISWSYYGERCFTFLFGSRTSLLYRVLFLIVIVLGSVVSATNVLNFSDLMILSMALPNMLGLYILSGKVRRALNDYWGMYKRGEFPGHKG